MVVVVQVSAALIPAQERHVDSRAAFPRLGCCQRFSNCQRSTSTHPGRCRQCLPRPVLALALSRWPSRNFRCHVIRTMSVVYSDDGPYTSYGQPTILFVAFHSHDCNSNPGLQLQACLIYVRKQGTRWHGDSDDTSRNSEPLILYYCRRKIATPTRPLCIFWPHKLAFIF